MDASTLERLAELVVGFGANVQRDQIVSVTCEPGKEDLTRAIAASAYRRGAKFVDVAWFDPWIKRARVEHAREETLDFVPDWYGSRILALGDQRAARIGLSGPSAPGLLEDLDPVRSGKDRLPAVKESGQGRQRPHDQLVDHPRAVAGVGLARVPGPAAGGGAGRARRADPAHPAARRGRPDRRLARARRHARGGGRAG